MLRQLAYILGYQRGKLESKALEDNTDVKETVGNVHFNAKFIELGKELGEFVLRFPVCMQIGNRDLRAGVSHPKTPEDIYKTHLTEGGGGIARREHAVEHDSPTHATYSKLCCCASRQSSAGAGGRDSGQRQEQSGVDVRQCVRQPRFRQGHAHDR